MPLPLSYKKQDGCWNCHYVFMRNDFEEEATYYCCRDGIERPLCDSHLMKEDFYTYLKSKGLIFNPHTNSSADDEVAALDELQRLWNTWAEDHKVSAWGTCYCHIKVSPCNTEVSVQVSKT